MQKKVQMIFWDVQHGHATYIRTPNGKDIVIDLGIGDYSGNNERFSPLAALWNKHGVRSLEYVVITHPHLDHFDDILNFDHFSPSIFTAPKYLSYDEMVENARRFDKEKFEKYVEICKRYSGGMSDDHPNNPFISDNYGGVKIQHFYTPDLPHTNFNNHSILTVIEYAGVKVIIPGDNEKASFDLLMQDENFRKAVKDADVLLAPHHGRESGYHEEFVSLVNPRITIVSDGSLCDTSANDRYSRKSRGWDVENSTTGKTEKRYCLTTNSDGEIYIDFGYYTKSDLSEGVFLSIQKK